MYRYGWLSGRFGYKTWQRELAKLATAAARGWDRAGDPKRAALCRQSAKIHRYLGGQRR